MAASINNNWIETIADGPSHVLWKVVRAGKAIHSDALDGVDPSGVQAYGVGLKWAETHCPGVSFHWRHQAYIPTTQRKSVHSGDASDDRKSDGDGVKK
jgi:hypothetical protein